MDYMYIPYMQMYTVYVGVPHADVIQLAMLTSNYIVLCQQPLYVQWNTCIYMLAEEFGSHTNKTV